MDYFLITLGALLLVCGFIGSAVPVLPGPILGYAALWTLVPTAKAPSTSILAFGAAIVVIVSIVDYVLPTFFAKKFKCSGWGVFGCAVGTIVGLFFLLSQGHFSARSQASSSPDDASGMRLRAAWAHLSDMSPPLR